MTKTRSPSLPEPKVAPEESKPISEPGKGPIKVFLAGKNAGGESRSTAAATRN
jgi:hypothetical protein